jgi:hypothetical protein
MYIYTHTLNRIGRDLWFRKQTQNKYFFLRSLQKIIENLCHIGLQYLIRFGISSKSRTLPTVWRTNCYVRNVDQQAAFTCKLVVPTAIAGVCPLWRTALQHRDMGRNNGVGRVWWCIAHTTSSPCLVYCRDVIYWCTVFPSVFVETNWRWNRRWTVLAREITDWQQAIILLWSRVNSLTSALYPFYKSFVGRWPEWSKILTGIYRSIGGWNKPNVCGRNQFSNDKCNIVDYKYQSLNL